MMVGMFHYLILSSIIFFIGIFGILLNKRNILSLIMSIEIILLSVNINFVLFSNYWNNFSGHVFVLFILTVSASEIAVVLAALSVYFNHRSNIWIDDLTNLKG